MKDEIKDKVVCKNCECSNNEDGYCTILTQSQGLYFKITCDEREW